jgi:hypothetical protein
MNIIAQRRYLGNLRIVFVLLLHHQSAILVIEPQMPGCRGFTLTGHLLTMNPENPNTPASQHQHPRSEVAPNNTDRLEAELETPDIDTLIEWEAQGDCEAAFPHGRWIEPDGTSPHGNPSWLLRLGLNGPATRPRTNEFPKTVTPGRDLWHCAT